MTESKKNTVVVSCLPMSLTDDELGALFEEVGKIKSCTISRDQTSGNSLGYGYVEYVKSYDADLAIDRLNGTQLKDMVIKVALLRQNEKKKGANLYVSNLPPSFTVEELEALFSAYGSIVQSKILMNQDTGMSRGVGFVHYNTKEEAEAAMKALNGKKLPGSTIALQVSFAEERKPQRFQQAPNPIAAGYAGGYEYEGAFGGFGVPRAPGIATRGAMRPARARGGFARRGVGGGPVRVPLMTARHRYNPVAAEGSYGGASTIPGANPTTSSQGYIVYAYNIGPQTTKDELNDLFSLYGAVSKVDVIWDFQKNMGKGYGFVTMPNYDEAVYAIQCLNGYNYAGKPLQVSFKSSKA